MKEKEDNTENEIQKDLFQDLPTEARSGMLRSHAYDVVTEVVQRQHTDEKLEQFKEELSEKSVELARMMEERKAMVAEIDSKIKPLKTEVGEIVGQLRNRYVETEEEVFYLDNQAEGLMEKFDSNGKFLGSRRLFPKEKQSKITSLKTGTE